MTGPQRLDVQLIGDVRAVARVGGPESVELLTTALTWRYEHALALARAVAASGSAVIVALAAPILVPQGADGSILLLPALGVVACGAITIGIGGVLYARARRFHAGLLRAQGLLARVHRAYGP